MQTHSPLTRSLSHSFACLIVLAAIAGCKREARLACHPVRGQVLVDNKPLAEALVIFHPQQEQATQAPKPLAFTNAEGRYQLTTLRDGDGALCGPYAITVELRAPRVSGEETVRDGRNLLPARYAKPETSKLAYQVVEGDNEVPPLELKAR